MKGLLIKDFKLLKMQKNFFFMIVVIAIGMAACMHDITFVYGYLMFIVSMFSLSTISYDEFDNGNAFLFTLPISRRGYVIEKYCFGLLLDFGSWILAFVLSIVVNIVNKSNDLLDVLVASAVIFAFMIILQAVMIPLQIKFGAEKSRIAIIAVVGITVVVAFVIAKCFEFFGIDVMNSLNSLSTLSVGVIIAIVVAIAIAAFALSMKISTSIMNRKEF